jgi:hypothetical protein
MNIKNNHENSFSFANESFEQENPPKQIIDET